MSEVRGYTLAQVRRWLEEIDRAERRSLRDRLLIARAARADGEGFESVMEALE